MRGILHGKLCHPRNMCKTKKWWKSVSQWFWFNYIHKDYPEELGVQKVATTNQIQTCRTLLSINSTITPSQEILKIPTNPRVSLNASKSSVNRITWRSKSSPDYSPLHQTSRFEHWTSPNHKKTYTIHKCSIVKKSTAQCWAETNSRSRDEVAGFSECTTRSLQFYHLS